MPSRYDQVRETLKYSREVLKVEDVAAAARSKEKESRNAIGTRLHQSKSHFVKGRSESRGFTSKNCNNSRHRSKSVERKKVC